MVMRVLRLASQRCVQGFSDDLVDEQEPEALQLEVQRIRDMPVRKDVCGKVTKLPTKHVGAAQRVLLARPRESIATTPVRTVDCPMDLSGREPPSTMGIIRIRTVIRESVATSSKSQKITVRSQHLAEFAIGQIWSTKSRHRASEVSGWKSIVFTSCRKAAFGAWQEHLTTQHARQHSAARAPRTNTPTSLGKRWHLDGVQLDFFILRMPSQSERYLHTFVGHRATRRAETAGGVGSCSSWVGPSFANSSVPHSYKMMAVPRQTLTRPPFPTR